MKNLLFTTVLLIMACSAKAQRITKVYGFWHYQPMGNIPVIPVGEGGNGPGNGPRTTPERRKVYYLYVESSSPLAPAVVKVVAHNITYTAAVQKIEALPAEYEYFDGQKPQKITLVGKGRKNVFALALTQAAEPVVTVKQQAELAIYYQQGKTVTKTSLAKLKVLPMPVVQ